MKIRGRKQVRIYGNTLAISGDPEQDWFIGWSPNYDSIAAEGPWDEWVRLARAILTEEKNRKQVERYNRR